MTPAERLALKLHRILTAGDATNMNRYPDMKLDAIERARRQQLTQADHELLVELQRRAAEPAPTPAVDVVATLRQAREVVARGWTQRALARDRYGITVAPRSPGATCWSLQGALIVVGDPEPFVGPCARRIAEHIGTCGHDRPTAIITQWEDDPRRTLGEVLDVLDRAIAGGWGKAEAALERAAMERAEGGEAAE